MNYKDVIEAKYNRSAWLELLHDIFLNKAQFWSSPISVNANKDLAKNAFNLGKISLPDGQTIAVYEVELTDHINLKRNQKGIRDIFTADWRSRGFAGAFVFAYRQNESVLRFSYVSEIWSFNKEGKYEKISTDTMRYTYLLGEGRGCRTAVDRFSALKNSKQTLSDITDAFSVAELTKRFYNELFEWFTWATTDGNISFPVNTKIEDDEKLEVKIIRLITRIMFVWFIKQKDIVPHRIFDEKFLQTILRNFDPQSTSDGCYYNAILQNLFFATLNRAIKDEDGSRCFENNKGQTGLKTLYRYAEMFSISEAEVVELFSEIPFLNGGLFECLDKTKTLNGVDQAYYFDGFSRNKNIRTTIPNILFFEPKKGLFSILSKYNFTIEENTPDEQQVALDPELLGKVFENLLGAYNPETRETARNQSGSFYTPREIVNYMVDESLIAYLGGTDFVRSLFAPNFQYEESKVAEYSDIAQKLKAVKVLDPACGSGAFPMGLLNRIVDILQRIAPAEDVYEQKLAIIENCLYGSDIQSIAAQITKLRFFISLIVDCEKDTSKPNYGMPTLPNLETKFVSANSLIPKKEDEPELFGWEIEDTKKKLADVRSKHFHAQSASAKRRLQKEDEDLRRNLEDLLLSSSDYYSPEEAKQLAEWNPYDQNAVSKFFDPLWMFNIKDGFDIVIGNPPYIQLQNNGGELAKLYENCGYKTFAKTGDIYCLFYERGHQLLKDGGHLCYITSNKWMRAGYGEKIRGFFATQSNPKLLIDFGGVQIFESATVDTNIILFAKGTNQHKTRCAVTKKQDKDSVKNLSLFVQQQNTECDFSSSDSWVILSPIEQSIKRKIEAVGTPLKDWDIQIYRGVLTGYNEAFIISTEKRNEILANCASEEEKNRTAELIRPILRGRDIKRYGYEWANLWLINTHNGVRGKIPRIEINDYPAVKAHLDQYWDKISTRADKGDTPYNLRNCAYMEDFLKPKIVYPNMTQFLPFVYDNRGYLTNQKCFIITGRNISYLTAFLNSSLFKFCFTENFPKLGEKGREMSKIFFDKIPVMQVANEIEIKFEAAVDDIQKEYTKSKAIAIDTMIFDLYNLSADERKVIGSVEIE